MSKDPAQNSHLLTKVVKFVTNPTTQWSDLDRAERRRRDQDHDADQASRQALKKIIERKRSNDFVRNREFDTLRKILRGRSKKSSELVPGISLPPSQRERRGRDLPPPPTTPSLPSSSAPAHARADTLMKIDQIERQMARSWFKKKGGQEPEGSWPGAQGGATASGRQKAPESLPDSISRKIDQIELQVARGWERKTEILDTSGFAPLATAPASVPKLSILQEHDPAAAQETLTIGGFAPTTILEENVLLLDRVPTLQDVITEAEVARQPLPEMENALTAENLDPELEEAAIRFANGDIQGAEVSLLALLGNDGARNNHVETWLALFDLYRASRQQSKFDEAAIDFASCFGRSAPQWSASVNTVPLAQTEAPEASPRRAPEDAAHMHWVCPPSLGPQSVAALGNLERDPSPWRVDWHGLQAIEEAALMPLVETLRRWGGTKGEYHLRGAARLLDVLAEHSPTDNREADPQWWSARLALLRLMDEMDEFELVALNYCVTYEVSPPAWEEPLARFVPIAEPSGAELPHEEEKEEDNGEEKAWWEEETHDLAIKASQPADFASSHAPETEESLIQGELSGVITDDVGKALRSVNLSIERTAHAQVVDINCRLLLRMDFGAAGSLLNWVTAQKALKRQIVLRHVNRLVGAFFGVIGIHEVAYVVPRKD